MMTIAEPMIQYRAHRSPSGQPYKGRTWKAREHCGACAHLESINDKECHAFWSANIMYRAANGNIQLGACGARRKAINSSTKSTMPSKPISGPFVSDSEATTMQDIGFTMPIEGSFCRKGYTRVQHVDQRMFTWCEESSRNNGIRAILTSTDQIGYNCEQTEDYTSAQ